MDEAALDKVSSKGYKHSAIAPTALASPAAIGAQGERTTSDTHPVKRSVAAEKITSKKTRTKSQKNSLVKKPKAKIMVEAKDKLPKQGKLTSSKDESTSPHESKSSDSGSIVEEKLVPKVQAKKDPKKALPKRVPVGKAKARSPLKKDKKQAASQRTTASKSAAVKTPASGKKKVTRQKPKASEESSVGKQRKKMQKSNKSYPGQKDVLAKEACGKKSKNSLASKDKKTAPAKTKGLKTEKQKASVEEDKLRAGEKKDKNKC